MGRKNRGGQKAWQTQLDHRQMADDAMNKIAQANKVRAEGSFNEWDASLWTIERMALSNGQKYTISAKEYCSDVRPWLTGGIASNQVPFEIWDEGNNFGITDCLLEIISTGTIVYTKKASYRLISK